MYPGRAVEAAGVAVVAGLVGGNLIAATIGWIVGSITGIDVFKPVSMFLLFLGTPSFWWWSLHREIQGLLIVGGRHESDFRL